MALVEPVARYEDVRVPLVEPVHGLDSVSGVLGVPEWWPTGSRVGIVLAHGSSGSLNDPLLVELHRVLTEHKVLTLRFNFPFAEAGKSRPDPLPVLERSLRAAISVFGRDPTAAPAHLFLVGKGLGGRAAAQLAASRVRADGLVFLGYPLHAPGAPSQLRVEYLFRIVSPMLFLQGTRDRQCDLDALRRTLARVGAPTTLHAVQDADQSFHVPKKSGRTDAEVREEIVSTLEAWMRKVIGE